jgi:hypothetical protein
MVAMATGTNQIVKTKIFHYALIREAPIEKLNTFPFSFHPRLRVFANKGCECVTCGKVGSRLVLGKSRGKKHWDVYTEDLYPLTVDHILPKSKGGGNEINNLQPMCAGCNFKKGNGDRPYRNKKGNNQQNCADSEAKKTILDGFTKVSDSSVRCDPNEYSYLIGQTVYRRHKKKTVKPIGIVVGICHNSYTGNLEVTLEEGKPSSVYDLETLWVDLAPAPC